MNMRVTREKTLAMLNMDNITIHCQLDWIIACNNNNMRNPMKQNVGRDYACCYCCMQLSLVCIRAGIVIHLCGSVNSELQTICYVVSLSLLYMYNFHVVSFPHIHKLCIWSHHNQLFTVHHSGHYNLVSLMFGTTIPISFNILMKWFLHLFH